METLIALWPGPHSSGRSLWTLWGAAAVAVTLSSCTTVLEDDIDEVDTVSRTVTETTSGPLGGTYVEKRETTTVTE